MIKMCVCAKKVGQVHVRNTRLTLPLGMFCRTERQTRTPSLQAVLRRQQSLLALGTGANTTARRGDTPLQQSVEDSILPG